MHICTHANKADQSGTRARLCREGFMAPIIFRDAVVRTAKCNFPTFSPQSYQTYNEGGIIAKAEGGNASMKVNINK